MTNPIVRARMVKNSDGREGLRHYYWCEGCDNLHGIAIRPHTQDNGAGWSFSGTLECPTYEPSQLSTIEYGDPDRPKFVCHTFICEGQMQFLSDCTHKFAGQTRPMVPLPDWLIQEVWEDKS